MKRQIGNPPPPRLGDLRSVRQLCEEYPQLFTEGSLRWLIFNAERNGFARCVIRTGRKVLIDQTQLRIWLAKHRAWSVPA